MNTIPSTGITLEKYSSTNRIIGMTFFWLRMTAEIGRAEHKIEIIQIEEIKMVLYFVILFVLGFLTASRRSTTKSITCKMLEISNIRFGTKIILWSHSKR